MPKALILFTCHWYISLFCQSFYLHRYSSHSMFKLKPFWDRFFYLLTFISQGPGFLNPRAYSILHQHHHMYSDGPRDPHSPHNAKNLWSMMLTTYKMYQDILINHKFSNDKEINHTYPTWPMLEKFSMSPFHNLLWIGIFIFIYQSLNIPWYGYGLLPLHFFVGPIQGAIVNWCGHKYGYQNFDNHDFSHNTLFFDFLLLGELYQNNHHHNGKNINFASRWFEVDLTYQIAKLFHRLHVIRIF
jgi:stearoyl-CoA desaturase (delta-9 desaturase)